MPFSNYTELQAEISDWMDRNDVSGKAADFIALGEAQLNRRLESVEATATLSPVIDSRLIDVSALKVIEPMSLWFDDGNAEVEISLVAAGTFEHFNDTGIPGYAALDGNNLVFDRLFDGSGSIRFRYRGRFALSGDAPTNDLLTNHPDVYLAASIAWGNLYLKDASAVAGFKALVEEYIQETSAHLSQRKRSVLRPSTDLFQMTGRGSYNAERDR